MDKTKNNKTKAELLKEIELLKQENEFLKSTLSEGKNSQSLIEEKMYKISDAALDAIILIDDEGKISYWNKAAYRIFGYSSEEVLGKELHSILVPSKYQKLSSIGFQKFCRTGEGNAINKVLEFEAVKKDGTLFPIELSVSAFLQNNKWNAVGILRDISERKKAETLLQQSTMKYKSLVNSLEVIVWEADSKYYQYTYVSPFAEQLLGYPTEKWITERSFWMEHIHPDDKQYAFGVFISAILKLESRTIEYRMIAADGRIVWLKNIISIISENGSVKLRGLMIDITDQKETEKWMLFMNYALGQSNDAIYLSEETGDMVYINDAACRMLDYTQEELMNLKVFDINPEMTNERWTKHTKQLKENGIAYFESYQKRKSGLLIPVDINVKQFKYEGTKYNLSIIRDITARKKYEETLLEKIKFEEHVAHLFENAPGFFSTLVIKPDGRNFMSFASSGINDIYGLEPKDVALNTNLLVSRIHPDDRKAVLRKVLTCIQNLLPFNCEYRVNHPVKGEIWIEARALSQSEPDGSILWYGFAHDITERKQVQKELEIINYAINHSTDSIFLMDENLNFTFVNDTACHSLGYTREELSKMTSADIDPDISNEAALEIFNRLLIDQIPGHFETRHRTKDGNIYPVEISLSLCKYNDENYSLSVARNISERKTIEDELRKSVREFKTLAENTPDTIARYDKNARRIYANRAFAEIAKLPIENLLNKTPSEYPSSEGALEYENKIKAVFNTGWNEQCELTWHDSDKKSVTSMISIVPEFDKDGNIASVLCVGRDITEQIKARKIETTLYKISEAVHASHSIDKLYALIHEYINELFVAKNFYIAIYDEKTNTISFPYFVDEFDLPPEPHPFGKGLTEYVLQMGEAQLIDSKKELELRKTGEAIMVGEPMAIWLGVPLRVNDKSIGVIVAQDYNNPQMYGEAEKKLLVYVADQIAIAIERKNNQEEIKTNLEKLDLLNKTKDKFFSILAHDLKNPFNSIFGFTELFLSDYYSLSDEERLLYIEEVKKSTKTTYNLLENLLHWSRSNTGRMEFHPIKLKMKEIIAQNIIVVERLAQNKEITIQTSVPNNVFISADYDMISTVVRNLLTNAIKYSYKGNVIKIDVEKLEDIIKTSIRDYGIGMDENTKSSIFKLEHVSSKEGTNKEVGSGLGLILCKEFIEKNGGVITVDSEPGKGSEFIFSLPSFKP